MTNKEFKDFWSSKTLGELKGYYMERVRVNELRKQEIKQKAEQLANLDFDHKYYFDKVKNLVSDLNFTKSNLKEDDTDLKILKPILDKKELEGINQEEYNNYITNNTDIRILIKAVESDKQEFINQGGKITIYNSKNEPKEITLTKKEINSIYDTMLKELILILKDNIGDIKEVFKLESNGNRGFDGIFKGTKGNVSINTILAGGYNIQKLHYRTLVYKY